MTTIIQTTPWGVCTRYYDDHGVLLYSKYVSRPSAKPTPRRWTPACLAIPTNFTVEGKNLALGVELAGA